MLRLEAVSVRQEAKQLAAVKIAHGVAPKKGWEKHTMNITDWITMGAVRTEYCTLACGKRMMACISNGRCARKAAGEDVEIVTIAPAPPTVVKGA
jgi:hypothetical protein